MSHPTAKADEPGRSRPRGGVGDAGGLLEAVRAQRRDFIDLVERLARLESPSTEPAAQAPLLDLLAGELEDCGLSAEKLPGRDTGGHLVARSGAPARQRPFQLLLGHCDTVWPTGTLEGFPVELDGTVLRGPGTYDMKGGLAAIIIALRTLARRSSGPLEVEPVVFVNSDEEIGSPESTPHIRGLARTADRVLVLEPSLGPEGLIKTRRKGVGHFEVRVRGRAAHAGLDPGEGRSAILELSHVVQALSALSDPERGVTVNVGTITGGSRANVVAAEASAVVDVRVLHPEDVPRVEEAIHSLEPHTEGVELRVEGRVGRPPMDHTAANRALWRLAQDQAARLGLEVAEGVAGGGSDGNTTSLYTATLDGLGAVGQGAHARHEQIDVDRTLERAALLAMLVAAGPVAASKDESHEEAAP